MYKIGLVEDEKNLNSLVKNYLEKEGYEVITFFNGEDVLNYEDLLKVQLWILDIMLGDGINGYDIIKFIREKNKNVPVIFTSARDQDIDKIVGLELGSDDYIAKPYSPRELVLRINNIVKRVYNDEKNQVRGEEIEISAPDSEVKVFVVPTNEELMIARETLKQVSQRGRF